MKGPLNPTQALVSLGETPTPGEQEPWRQGRGGLGVEEEVGHRHMR